MKIMDMNTAELKTALLELQEKLSELPEGQKLEIILAGDNAFVIKVSRNTRIKSVKIVQTDTVTIEL
jgi:hypothetical protein